MDPLKVAWLKFCGKESLSPDLAPDSDVYRAFEAGYDEGYDQAILES